MDDVELVLNRLCHLVVAMERDMARARDAAGRALDLPMLGVLVSTDLLGPLRPGGIAEAIGMSSGGTTKLVDRLERAGYVTRSHGMVEHDRRAVVVTITDRGRDAVQTFERVVVGLAPALVEALDALLGQVDEPGGEAPRPASSDAAATPAGPVLAQMLRFVAMADAPLWAAAGDVVVLQPSDPRGLLVLAELDLRGPLRVGEVQELVDRSRGSTSALIAELSARGFVAREQDPADGRTARVRLTSKGRAAIRRMAAGLADELDALRPAMVDLARELRSASRHADSNPPRRRDPSVSSSPP